MAYEPLLGWVSPKDRTNEQNDAHIAARGHMVKFSLPNPKLAKGQAVRLFDFWKHPDVVTDVGFTYTRIHQKSGSCFPAGTPVRMADGSEKVIEDVSVGQEVVSHTGASRKVMHTMNRKFSGDMVTLHVRGYAFPLTMTADHHVAIMRANTNWRWQPDYLEWVRADKIEEGDHVLIGWGRDEKDHIIDTLPLLGEEGVDLEDLANSTEEYYGPYARAQAVRETEFVRSGQHKGKVHLRCSKYENAIARYIPLTESLAKLIGIYLAEGGVNDGRITFTFSSEELDTLAAETVALVKDVFGTESEVRHEPDKGRTTVRVPNATLAMVFKSLMPGNVYSKRVPGMFFTATRSVKSALLAGWFAGDGYYRAATENNCPAMIGVTSSNCLARDITTLSLSVGYRTATGRRKPYKQSKEAWNINLGGEQAHKAMSAAKGVAVSVHEYRSNKDAARCKFGYARTVKKIEKVKVENLQVYDFEVEEDHSFLAGGLVVHNCVAAGGTNAVFSTIAAQRLASDNPTKAFMPFCWHNYAMSRHYMGTDRQGEGSLGSTFAKSLGIDGIRDWVDGEGLPKLRHEDGLVIGAAEEMKWSSFNHPGVAQVLPTSRQHLFGSTAECRSADDIKAMVLNGYGVTFACNYYVGNASVQGSGDEACLIGKWDTYGPHQQSVHAVWEHPRFGTLLWAQNSWPKEVYPGDPAGGPVCGCWVPIDNVAWAMRQDGEVYGLSHLNWFPAQVDKLLDFSKI